MGLDNPLHTAFLLIVLLMVFGAKRLPEMGKSLGTGMRGFKDALNPDSAPRALGAGSDPERAGAVAEQPARERAAA